MEKNWLIRTHQNQILGPISKERVVEFIKKGNLTSDDEICSGNGYWFQVKEKELLEKYVYGGELQPFNPISEAKSVFSEEDMDEKLNEDIEEVLVKTGQDVAYPDNSDLDFPDSDSFPKDEDLDFPEETRKETLGPSPRKKIVKKKKIRKKKIKKEALVDTKRNDRFLFYIFLFLLGLLLCVFIFYKNALNNLFPKVSSYSLFFPDAVAQTIEKKKAILLRLK